MTKKQRLPLPAVIALLVLAAVLLGAGGFFVLVHPQRTRASELSEEIAAVQAKIDANRAEAARVGGVEPIKVADLFRLSKAMPDRADMSGVLLELNRVAAESGITFESIAPQTSVPISGYQAMPISLTFRGNFYNLADFLYRLRNLVSVDDGRLDATGRLFAIDTLDFAESQAGFPQIGATLVVDAFVYGTGVPATATPLTTTSTTAAGAAETPSTTTTTPDPATGASAAGATP
jgi:hypothetical protein